MPLAPTLDDFLRLPEGDGTLVPVWREILADGDTPVSACHRLGAEILLESVVGGATWARYSFIGAGWRARFTARDGRYRLERRNLDGDGALSIEEGDCPDPASKLESLLATDRPVPSTVADLPRFFGGAVGFFAYDVVRRFERLPSKAPDILGLPDACFLFTDALVIFDNLRQTLRVVVAARTDGDRQRSYARAATRIDEIIAQLRRPETLPQLDLSTLGDAPPSLTSDTTRERFLAAVDRAKEYILAGDVFQVVLSQRFSARTGADPFSVYRALRVINPSPYMFHLTLPDVTITGASPEVLVRAEAGRVTVRPIAGTRPRGRDDETDRTLEAELVADPKERAEHVMLIDLGRNDVGRVATIGSVRVDEQMAVERYSHVMHLVSRVSGELAPGRRPMDALRACFPAGTLSGAPKIRAMEVIEELEPSRRGIYGGAVGYVGWGADNLDFAIAIRTLVTIGDITHVQAGAGIVADSSPSAEYDETVNKARAVLRALTIRAAT
jgi:anthranilate synthase component 1